MLYRAEGYARFKKRKANFTSLYVIQLYINVQ